jgi:hypothetical protein
MTLQCKGDVAICSSVGDIKKHEKFKKLSKEKRIEKLQEVYDQYGVRSTEFFIQVKPFIMWTIYRHLRGMPNTYLEDLVNNAYTELIIAFEGGHTTHYNEAIYKQPIYATPLYYKKYKNIGAFIMAVVGSSVAKYRSKTFRRKCIHEDDAYDISERINFTDFEMDNDLGYETKDPELGKTFEKFKFNKEFLKHIAIIKETKPKNNVLYNYVLWKESMHV